MDDCLVCSHCGGEQPKFLCSVCLAPYCGEQCADDDWEQHQPYCDHATRISYELYLPTIGILAKVAGPKNQVHQRITELIVLQVERGEGGGDYFKRIQSLAQNAGLSLARGKQQKLTARRLIEGVIWNDLPSKRAEATGGKYPVTFVKKSTAQRITRKKIFKNKTIPGDRFRFNPSTGMLIRLGAIFARAKLAKFKLGKVPADNIIFQSHFGNSAHWHSMAAENGGTVGSVIKLINNQAIEWYKLALKRTDLFDLGHILHMIQDSYSRAHAIREPGDASGTIVTKFQSFATQSADLHAGADSMSSFERNPAKAELLRSCVFFLIKFREWLAFAAKNKGRTQRKTFQDAQITNIRKELNTKIMRTTPKYSKLKAGGCEQEFCAPKAKAKPKKKRRRRRRRSRK